jgi:Ni,Fe-hydrogenase I cytochrome b subunit
VTHTTNPTLILGIVAVFGIAAAVHLVRRHDTLKTKTAVSADLSFDRVQRLLHWSIGLGAAALFVTGLPIYLSQFLVSPPVPTPLNFFYWGVVVSVWRNTHIYLALLVTALVVLHASWDVIHLRRTVKVSLTRQDFRDTVTRAKDFFVSPRDGTGPTRIPAKYDPLQKAFHWSLVVLGAFLLVSGLLEWEQIKWQGIPLFVWLDRWNGLFMDGFMRTGHLVAAMLFAGLAVLHVYFALLPQNRSMLMAITTGNTGSPRAHASPWENDRRSRPETRTVVKE